MWHDIVSTLNRAADSAVSQAMSAYLQHPFVAAGFLISLSVLFIMLCVEVVRGRGPDEVVDRPILIRR